MASEIAERLDHCDDLGGQASSRPANGLISSLPFAPMPCWWTRTIMPSMIVYSKSRSLDKASKRLSNTPFKGPAAEAPEDRIPKPEWVATGAPETKIEITPEMIERGLIEFFDYDPEGNEAEEIVEKIFRNSL
jgi:hypothetical protein